MTLFAWEFIFNAAVEEEGYVRVFLGFRNT
ncbi:Uncharacterised protein [Vibrio cholerae]|nr:Uncharacterised protein [Vibrio cholerae]